MVAFCLALLVALSLGWSPQVYAQTEYESIAILLNNVKQIRYRYADSDGNSGEMGFQVLGEETVQGEATWKVKLEVYPKGKEATVATLWVSKSTGKCLQVELKGEVHTGAVAELFWSQLLVIWMTYIGTHTRTWEFAVLYNLAEGGYGRVTFLGFELRTVGPTQLLVYKWKWEGYSSAPEPFRRVAEYWFAPTSFGNIVVKLYLESSDRQRWLDIELLSIELVSPQPRPNITIADVKYKEQVAPNEEDKITIVVSNTGDAMGARNLTITVNGKVEKSSLVVLNPGETKSLNHTLSFAAEGTYTVEIDGITFTITVSKISPAKFEVSDLSINPSSIKVGDSSMISVNVKNTGGQPGTYEVTLKVNNQVVETKTVTLDAGKSTTVSFSYTPASEGTYTIDVNGLTGSLIVGRKSEETQEGPAPEASIVSVIPWLIILVVVIVIIALALVLRRKRAA
ncbi:MAG: CARDB domain-containing protein [Thermofilaceae archaeon]